MAEATPDGPPQASQGSASLLRRLAGPSSGKAGLAKDQTEINRIIAEASKGSKFYENEKRKDKELTERIQRLLKERDELVKCADFARIEESVDRFIVEVEAERDLTQYIVHVDMDAFYANVELLHNPDLAGKPFGVGGGVLTTASYEARKFGVRSGMAGFVAKKLCPELILVKPHFSRYSEMSKQVMVVFQRYDSTMMMAGCDEGYLNITAHCEENSISPDECVRKMRAEVVAETKLTVSAGIAPNRMLAKICSDKNKPNGQFHLPFERGVVMQFAKDLSIRKIPGIGRVNERLLESIGIQTCGDIHTHRAVLCLMDKTFGLRHMLRIHLGIASNVVQPGQREERKSIGAERTFGSLSDKGKITQKLDDVAEELESDMKRSGWAGKTVTLKYKLDNYQVFTRAKTFDRWVTRKEDLLAAGLELLKDEWPLCLRLIGLRMTKLKDLQAPEPSSGIKRFMKPSGIIADSPPSLQKRQKLEHDHEDSYFDRVILKEEPEEPTTFFVGDDDVEAVDPDVETLSQGTSSIHIEPKFDGSRQPQRKSPSPPGPLIDKGKDSSLSTQVCPICGTALSTNNDGLNAHVDFCLSKSAIREATRGSSHSPEKRAGAGKPSAQSRTTKPGANAWDALLKPSSSTKASRGGAPASRRGAAGR